MIFKTLALPFFPQSTVAQNRNVYRIKKILINLKLRDKDYSFFVFPLLIKVLVVNIGFRILYAVLVLFQPGSIKNPICQMTDLPF